MTLCVEVFEKRVLDKRDRKDEVFRQWQGIPALKAIVDMNLGGMEDVPVKRA